MITIAHFHNFRIAEVLRFLLRVLETCKKYDPVKLLIQQQVTNLETATNKLDSVFKLSQGSELSEAIAEYDRLRDRCITGIKMCSESYTYHFDPLIRDAARRILSSIELYGKNIPQQNYQTETTTLFDIYSNWTTKTALVSDLTTLNLTTWGDEMDRLNKLFSTTQGSRAEEESKLPGTTATEERKVAIEVYRKLAGIIEARDTISTDGAYLPLISEINVIVNEFNILVDKREDEDDKNTGTKTSGS